MKCIVCHEEFEAKRKDAKFCSPVCRKKSQRGVEKTLEAKLEADQLSYEERLKKFIAMGIEKVEFLKTGIPELDSLGGIPRGRVTEIYGPEGAGKSTLVLNLLHNLKGEKILYIDTEGSTDPVRLADLGFNPDLLIYKQIGMIEDAYDEILEGLGKYAAIILDSVANCSFRTEIENGAGDANIGVKARILNKLMRVTSTKLGRTALILVNQERTTIGGYITQVYTPGGQGITYASSLRLRMTYTKGSRFPAKEPYQGHEVTVEVTKSKVCRPFQKIKFKLYYEPHLTT